MRIAVGIAIAFVVTGLTACTQTVDYYGLRCWERACIAGDEAWRQGKQDVARKYYAEATHIAQSKNLGSDRINLSQVRILTLEKLQPEDQPVSIDDGSNPIDRSDEAKNLLEQKKYGEASVVLESMLGQAPAGDIGQRLRLAHLLGDCYNHLGQYNKTIDIATPIVHDKNAQKNTSEFMKSMTVLSNALIERGHFSVAKTECELWRNVVESDPLHKSSELATVSEWQSRAMKSQP